MRKFFTNAAGSKLGSYAMLGLSAAIVASFTSCIDSKYDLSDIDSTVRVSVNDLTLPINIDEIQLESILDLKEDGIVQNVDGEYAILRTGQFSSSNMNVDPISITPPEPSHSTTTFVPELPQQKGHRAGAEEIEFKISTTEGSQFTYKYDDVSEDIVGFERLGLDWSMNYDVKIEVPGMSISSFGLKNIVFRLPKGLTGTPSLGTYNPSTGEITIPSYQVTGGFVKFTMTATAIDCLKAGVIFHPESHYLEISDKTGITGGKINVKAADVSISGIPSEIKVTTSLTLSKIDIKTFTGKIKYNIDNISIAPVNLNDLPDVLAQSGTDIRLENPQIYLDITNPFSRYSLTASTGFALEALRDGLAPVRSAIDAGSFAIYSASKSYYCLSPFKPDKYYQGYQNATHIGFKALSTALSGQGLPTKINIDLNPTLVPEQHVADFALGSYPGVEGNYVFFSPLTLDAGSIVEYTSTEDGWNDDTVDKLTIQTLKVSAFISNSLPFDINFTGYPIDKEGKRIGNVAIEGAVVKAGETDAPVEIYITGEITHLDGIRFTAKAIAAQNAQTLLPTQKITLNTIRATVSGWYQDKL